MGDRPNGAAGIFKSLATVVVATLVTLLLLELGLRLMAGGQQRRPQGKQILSYDPRHHHARENRGADCYPSNPRGYFERVSAAEWAQAKLVESVRYTEIPLEGLYKTPYCAAFTNNRLGRRGPVYPLARQSGSFRVLVLGDSFTYGVGVKDADTMPVQLERALKAQHPQLDVQVINLGEPAQNTAANLHTLRRHLRFRPDVVLLGYLLNDIRFVGAERGKHAANDFVMVRPDNERRPTRIEQLARRWSWLYGFVDARLRAYSIHRRTRAWYRDAFDGAQNPKGLEETRRLLAEIKRLSEGAGAHMAVAIYPILYNLGQRYPFAAAHRQVRSILAGLGIPSLDLLEPYRAHTDEQLRVHPVDFHPNELGQRLAAEAIAKWLQQRGLVKAYGGTGAQAASDGRR